MVFLKKWFSSPGHGTFSPHRWTRLVRPSVFFLLSIYYDELFLKLYCFGSFSPTGALFTLLFTLPVALLLGLLCGGVSPRRGRVLLPLCTGLISLWLGAQAIYYRLFKTFLTLFSLTKMAMVAGAFGNMAASEILLNWFPVLMMAVPVVLSLALRKKLVPDGPQPEGLRLRWAVLAAAIQLFAIGIVLCCGSGVMSLRYVYFQAAAPELETQCFGMLTQTQLEIRRVLFGIKPDDPTQHHRTKWTRPASDRPYTYVPSAPEYAPEEYNVMDLDFDSLIRNEENEELLAAHRWFAQRQPSGKNQWTGAFKGKNLVWVVAEGFSTLAMDPVRTPTLWQLSHQGFVFQNFYTPLWGVSTSDGEYVTTTGLIPKSGVWSYSQSSSNYMPFALGTQFRKQGYRTMAFHDYLFDYYDRNLSHPNMGYDYVALGQGLEAEDIIPQQFLEAENSFPPSDRMMMEEIVPMFVNEDRFMVYCLTVSGHLNYTLEENAMSVLHWDEVKDLPYSDAVKCYLASQTELELAMESLVSQLETAGKLEDTVIVLSADHYPYGLTDEEYSELLGHGVDPVFEIYKNSLILWSADMKEPVYVDKYCSSLDVMPTLSKRFGLEYDSRLVMGSDILSDSPGLVICSNYSFLNQEGTYNSVTDQFTRWDGQAPDLERVTALVADVQNRVAYSSLILDQDYYRLVLNGPPLEERSALSRLIPHRNSDTRPEDGRRP